MTAPSRCELPASPAMAPPHVGQSVRSAQTERRDQLNVPPEFRLLVSVVFALHRVPEVVGAPEVGSPSGDRIALRPDLMVSMLLYSSMESPAQSVR